jgi:hypothetical protein
VKKIVEYGFLEVGMKVLFEERIHSVLVMAQTTSMSSASSSGVSGSSERSVEPIGCNIANCSDHIARSHAQCKHNYYECLLMIFNL